MDNLKRQRVRLALTARLWAVAATVLLPTVARCELPTAERTVVARDSLSIAGLESDAARPMLESLRWQPIEFSVSFEIHPNRGYDRLVRFPSPHPNGDANNDSVSMEWYAVRDDDGNIVDAPAVVVVHESGSGMEVGRLFARGIQANYMHAFMIHLPYYGARRGDRNRPDGSTFLRRAKQGVGDVRRARDAIAALPHIDNTNIGLQGTSLGGFIAATTAGLDDAYDNVFIMLAGGDLNGLLEKGERAAAKLRKNLANAGYEGEKLRRLLWQVEPTRLAHRINRDRTWLYSGTLDRVVPLENAEILAKAAMLPDGHHVLVEANHYSAIAYFPTILRHMTKRIRGETTD